MHEATAIIGAASRRCHLISHEYIAARRPVKSFAIPSSHHQQLGIRAQGLVRNQAMAMAISCRASVTTRAESQLHSAPNAPPSPAAWPRSQHKKARGSRDSFSVHTMAATIAGEGNDAPLMTVRTAAPGDWERFKDLWVQYCIFYETEVPLDVTQHTWERCLDPEDAAMLCLVAEMQGGLGVVGFATGIVHPSTFSKSDMMYLEDLFVSPEARGNGAATALIARMKEMVEERGYRKLYWHTLENNKTAQSLYSKLAKKTDFIRYDTDE